jgi:hypothetical protein
MTNSLAANDVAAVHGGCASQRKDLLAGGVSSSDQADRGVQVRVA